MISRAVPIWFLWLFRHALGSWSPFGEEVRPWRGVCYVWCPRFDWKASTNPCVTASDFVISFPEWAGYQPGKNSKGLCVDPHCDTAVLSVGPIGPFMTWEPRPCTYSGEIIIIFIYIFFLLPVSVPPAAHFCPRALHDALLNWHHAWGPPSAGIVAFSCWSSSLHILP